MDGSINIKIIKGHAYYIYQFREGGKMKNRSLSKDVAYTFGFEMEHAEPGELHELRDHRYNMKVSLYRDLYQNAEQYGLISKRYCYKRLDEYLHSAVSVGKVLVLYGLRGSGKTTLMMQAIANATIPEFAKTVYIKVPESTTASQLKEDLDFLIDRGIRYFFIDEATNVENFDDLASELTEVYGAKARIVLSGNDSLLFELARNKEFEDRSIALHTTYIPYKEYVDLFGPTSLADYIHHLGLPRSSQSNKGEFVLPLNKEISAFVETSIGNNVDHSFSRYKDIQDFGTLYPIYAKGEIPAAMTNALENQARKLLRKALKRVGKTIAAQKWDAQAEQEERMLLLSIKKLGDAIKKEEKAVELDKEVTAAIEGILDTLDLSTAFSVYDPEDRETSSKSIFTLSGIRYGQIVSIYDRLAKEVLVPEVGYRIAQIVKDAALTLLDKKFVEESIQLQTLVYSPDKKVLSLRYAGGKIPLVVIDEAKGCMDLYMIRNSAKKEQKDVRILKDGYLMDQLGKQFYDVRQKCILYFGEDAQEGGIIYKNIEKFLAEMPVDF